MLRVCERDWKIHACGRVTWGLLYRACDRMRKLVPSGSVTLSPISQRESSRAPRRESARRTLVCVLSCLPSPATSASTNKRIAKAMSFKRFGVEVDDVAIVIEHNVISGDAAKNATLLAVIRSDYFESFKALGGQVHRRGGQVAGRPSLLEGLTPNLARFVFGYISKAMS